MSDKVTPIEDLFAKADNYVKKSTPPAFTSEMHKLRQAKKKPFVDTGLMNYAPNDKERAYGVITEKRLEAILPDLEKLYDFWLAYPDKMVEQFQPVDTSFKLMPFQVISMRANARHKRVVETAPRGFSKSFKAILSKMLKCTLLPNSKEAMLAGNKIQAARIGKEKVEEIQRLLPFFVNEIDYKKGSGTVFGKDYIHLTFKNGSQFDIVSILESERGGRRHGLNSSPFAQECA